VSVDISQWDDTLFTLHNKAALLRLYHLWFTGSRETRLLMAEEVQKAALWCGLSIEELGDDIIPDIDFVQRVSPDFTLIVDSELMAEVRDRNNIRPEETDIPTEIVETRNRLQELLDAAKTVQTILLERAMIDERRWSAEAFQRHFLYHPVKCHIAQQLIWGIYDGDQLLRTFHIMNDLSLSYADYHSLDLPPNCQVGIPHPLHLTDAEREQWLHLLHDYKIIQPFPQITRKIYYLSEENLEGTHINLDEQYPTPSKALSKYHIHDSNQEQRGWYFCLDEDDENPEYVEYTRNFLKNSISCYVTAYTTRNMLGEIYKKQYHAKFIMDNDFIFLRKINPVIISETLHFLHFMFQQDAET
jgi:hypothetical protein